MFYDILYLLVRIFYHEFITFSSQHDTLKKQTAAEKLSEKDLVQKYKVRKLGTCNMLRDAAVLTFNLLSQF